MADNNIFTTSIVPGPWHPSLSWSTMSPATPQQEAQMRLQKNPLISWINQAYDRIVRKWFTWKEWGLSLAEIVSIPLWWWTWALLWTWSALLKWMKRDKDIPNANIQVSPSYNPVPGWNRTPPDTSPSNTQSYWRGSSKPRRQNEIPNMSWWKWIFRNVEEYLEMKKNPAAFRAVMSKEWRANIWSILNKAAPNYTSTPSASEVMDFTRMMRDLPLEKRQEAYDRLTKNL